MRREQSHKRTVSMHTPQGFAEKVENRSEAEPETRKCCCQVTREASKPLDQFSPNCPAGAICRAAGNNRGSMQSAGTIHSRFADQRQNTDPEGRAAKMPHCCPPGHCSQAVGGDGWGSSVYPLNLCNPAILYSA